MDTLKQEVPKKCALYARCNRRGTRSVELQVADCRLEAQKRGWIVANHHVFTDAGHYSRIAMSDRPGLESLLAAARSEPKPFDYVIVDGTSRLSHRYLYPSTSECKRLNNFVQS
jgi:DNA invertase Pin-like site-specific DNA recombinase